MENQSLLPVTSVKDEKKQPSIARRIMPFALVLVVISLGFVITYKATNTYNNKSNIINTDTTLLKADNVVKKSDITTIKDAVKTNTFNPTPINLHPTHKPTEEKRTLKEHTHKPTHKHSTSKPTRTPTKGNPSYTSSPTPKGFVDDETYNPTPVDLHPTKKPTKDEVLKVKTFLSSKRVLHKEDVPRGLN
jgi:hypothetical protein